MFYLTEYNTISKRINKFWYLYWVKNIKVKLISLRIKLSKQIGTTKRNNKIGK